MDSGPHPYAGEQVCIRSHWGDRLSRLEQAAVGESLGQAVVPKPCEMRHGPFLPLAEVEDKEGRGQSHGSLSVRHSRKNIRQCLLQDGFAWVRDLGLRWLRY